MNCYWWYQTIFLARGVFSVLLIFFPLSFLVLYIIYFSPLIMCNFRLVIDISSRSFFIDFNTSIFDIFSTHEILEILRYIHSSKASSFFISFFVGVHDAIVPTIHNITSPNQTKVTSKEYMIMTWQIES